MLILLIIVGLIWFGGYKLLKIATANPYEKMREPYQETYWETIADYPKYAVPEECCGNCLTIYGGCPLDNKLNNMYEVDLCPYHIRKLTMPMR